MNASPTTHLVVVEAALAPHVLDLLDTAGIAGQLAASILTKSHKPIPRPQA